MRLLIIEDDRTIAENLYEYLESRGHQCDYADCLATASRLLDEQVFEAAVLDRNLPDGDGLVLARRLRAKGNPLPLLILTARDTLEDKLLGFDAGVDDYLVKPFAFDELLARLRALFRRHRLETAPDVYRYADLELNPRTRQVFRNEDAIELTAKEFDLLELFMRHPGQVLTREMIYEHIWDYDFGGESNIIEVYVRYLRTKLEATGKPRLIQTVRGVGYALRES